MSENSPDGTLTVPKTERWVYFMACAFVPAIAGLFVPEPARIPLFAISALVFIGSFALMLRHSRREENERR